MAALRGSRQLSQFLRCNSVVQQRAISKLPALSAWNKDWMPSKEVAKTAEEIEKVAAKYNVPPEHYKVQKEPYGDYPDLGTYSQQHRDPHYHWDDYVMRRDYGEFVDLKANMYSEDRVDPLYWKNNTKTLRFMVGMFLFVMVGIGGTWQFYFESYPINIHHFETQFPWNNKKLEYVSVMHHDRVGNFDRAVHYSFEPANKADS